MGLIKLIKSSVERTFADSIKEYYRCDNMTNDVLVMPATKVMRNGACNNASDRVITNGSVFDVAAGQAALLIENGKVYDFVLATEDAFAGQYKYDSTVEPSFLAAPSIKEALKVGIQTAKENFMYGGQSHNTMNIIYINLKEITKNPIGFGKTPFRDKFLGIRVNLSGHGYYTFKISDPMAFYENLIMDYNKKYLKEDITDQLRQELIPIIMNAVGNVAPMCENGYDDILVKRKEITDFVNSELMANENWSRRGITMLDISITPQLSPEDEDRVRELEDNKAYANSEIALGSLVRAQGNAVQAAAGNANGAAMGFYSMNMAQQAMNGGTAQTLIDQINKQNQPNISQSASSWKCSCGTENTGNFCQNCGSKKPGMITCPDCGTQIPVGNTPVKFCTNCGKKFD